MTRPVGLGNPSSRLPTIPALTRMFSASLSCRSQVVMNTASGSRSPIAAAVASASCRFAVTNFTAACSVGRRARPCTFHPCSASSAAVALPTIPLAPTTSAVFVIAASLSAPELGTAGTGF